MGDFACDIEEHGNCDSQIDAFRTAKNNLVNELRHRMNLAESNYLEAASNCSQATDETTQKQTAETAQLHLYNKQREDCQELHEKRILGMCTFGSSLQRKCDKVSAYKALIADIEDVNRTGGVSSQPDREEEYETLSKVTC